LRSRLTQAVQAGKATHLPRRGPVRSRPPRPRGRSLDLSPRSEAAPDTRAPACPAGSAPAAIRRRGADRCGLDEACRKGMSTGSLVSVRRAYVQQEEPGWRSWLVDEQGYVIDQAD